MSIPRLAETDAYFAEVEVFTLHEDERTARMWGSELCAEGIFLQTNRPWPVGLRVGLQLAVDGQPIYIRTAEVVGVRPFEPINVDGAIPGMRVRFLEVDPPYRAALRRYGMSTPPLSLVPEPAEESEASVPAPPPTAEVLRPLSLPAIAADSAPPGLDDPTAPELAMPEPPASVTPIAGALEEDTDSDHPLRDWRFERTPPLVDDSGDWQLGAMPPPGEPSRPHRLSAVPVDAEREGEELPDDDFPADPFPDDELNDMDALADVEDVEDLDELEDLGAPEGTASDPGSAPDPAEDAGAWERPASWSGKVSVVGSGSLPPVPGARSARGGRLLGAAIVLAGGALGAMIGLSTGAPAPLPPIDGEAAAEPPASLDAQARPRSVAEVEAALKASPSGGDEGSQPASEKSPSSTEVAEREVPAETSGADTKTAAKPKPEPASPYPEGEELTGAAANPTAVPAPVAPEPEQLVAPIIERGRITIPLRGGRITKQFGLAGPPRVVVDLEGAKYPGFVQQEIRAEGIVRYRIGKPTAGVVRVVVELEGEGAPGNITAVKPADRIRVAWRQ